MYAREEAIAGAGLVVEGLSSGSSRKRSSWFTKRTSTGSRERSLEMVGELGDHLGALGAWLALAEPAAEEWQRFLGEHAELG